MTTTTTSGTQTNRTQPRKAESVQQWSAERSPRPANQADAAGRRAALNRLGLMIPQFPGQTHISWWRVGMAMRELGVDVQMLSTRRAPDSEQVHDVLREEAARTRYVWPPAWLKLLYHLCCHPSAAWKAWRYVLSLPESRPVEKIRKLPLVVSGLELRRYADQRSLDFIYIHSCADAAHLGAICRITGGPPYALRLGGDLETYGKDHEAKMRHASLIVPGARPYIDRVVREAGVPRERIMWTWVGVDTRQYTPPAQARREDGRIRVVTVARLNYVKGYEHALEAIARLRDEGLDISYRIIGSGPREQIIREKVSELDLDDRVQLLGACDRDRVIEVLRDSDFGLLCSFGIGESSPAFISEAMACGLPAICTRIGSTDEMIRDGVDGYLVDQKDVDAIANAARRLARDRDLRQRMGRAARERAVRVFDSRVVAARILAAISRQTGLVIPEAAIELASGGAE